MALSRLQSILHLSLISIGLLAATAAISLNLDDIDEKIMYSLGAMTAENFQMQEQASIIKVNPDAFIRGFEDGLANKKQLTNEQMSEALQHLYQKQQSTSRDPKMSELNLKTGQEFLASNKKNKQIKELQNGLQYQVLASGDKLAKSPTINDRVKVHYRGTLLDGTEFDSSYNRSAPATFDLKSLIPGWQQALTLMKPNAKWRLFVPPQLAYGSQGAGSMIGPNEVLIFDIELLAVNPT